MKSVRKLIAGLALTGAVAAVATIDVNPAHAQASKKAIEGKSAGTIKGKVTLDGDAPGRQQSENGSKQQGPCPLHEGRHR